MNENEMELFPTPPSREENPVQLPPMSEFGFSPPESIVAAAAPTPSAPEVTACAAEPTFPAPEPVLPAPEPVFAAPIPVSAAAPVRKRDFVSSEPKKKKQKVSLGAFIAVVLVFAILLSCSGVGLYMLYRYCEELESTQDALAGYYQELELAQIKNQNDLAALQNNLDGLSGKDSTSESGIHLTPNQIYATNVNAVVSISCLIDTGFTSGYATGSGFIYSEDGYILTNAHVVEDAEEILVTTYNDREMAAELIGMDSLNDVAILKVEANDLPHVTLGSSADVAVGEQVAAIGNPLGSLSFSLTVGYVSAKDRIVNTEGTSTNMIQTDVAINSGNSGGPLFNMSGQVIGITSAKYSGESASGATIEGISFAIPIDDVMALMPELMETGTVSYAYLGVSVQDAYANEKEGTPAGAKVVETFADFAAEKSGILADDIIIKVEDQTVTSVGTLTMALKNYKPGDTVNVVVFRDGEEIAIPVVLDERPED